MHWANFTPSACDDAEGLAEAAGPPAEATPVFGACPQAASAASETSATAVLALLISVSSLSQQMKREGG
ncbi:hypothetical protein Psi01_11560 [Planobispora siamensis]|uniref:Uncharacterized protein n=1 Tax=Planobispora siamensis TaxID=936338 RepID=A0A8J3WK75_9ACTN|nr:hypothetical protein Psi01_11560 [Planobispora siamensis]